MKYFLDTEFNERPYTIQLISLALVAEDGRKYYAVSNQWEPDDCNEWVTTHVLPSVWEHASYAKTPEVIRDEVLMFIGAERPEFWGYYADYDWVAFCWLFGAMAHLPKGWPMYCRDLKQLCDMVGNPALPARAGKHHALHDARWNMEVYQFLRQAVNREGYMDIDGEGGAA